MEESAQYFLEMSGRSGSRVMIPDPMKESAPNGNLGRFKIHGGDVWRSIRNRYFPVQSMHGYRIQSRIKAITIRKRIQDRYFSFRQFLVKCLHDRFEILVDEVFLSIEDFGNTLKWPFQRDLDPLMLGFHTIRFFNWNHQNGTPIDPNVEDGQHFQGDSPKLPDPLPESMVYCPLDGPVQPLLVKLRTSAKSWRQLGGREWGFWVCPHCLGQFKQELLMMS